MHRMDFTPSLYIKLYIPKSNANGSREGRVYIYIYMYIYIYSI